MAGFLRKQSKHEPPTKPNSVQLPPTSSTSVPPLFARFAHTQQVQEPPRLVSSPMTLSGTRRDVAAPPQNKIREGRTVAQVAAHPRPHAETRMPQNQLYTPGRAGGNPTEQANKAPAPRQHSPTQVRARPTSRVYILDKPLPPPLGLDFEAPPEQVSAEHPSPLHGEYAHLWSMISGEDTQLDVTSTNEMTPVQVPSKVNQATSSQAMTSPLAQEHPRPTHPTPSQSITLPHDFTLTNEMSHAKVPSRFNQVTSG
ncbi:hypothetical protein DXG03_008532 [Asterophora parasitica]|uniref:Uncharacterized protein n=1 Tax=Asterophora parasitica TaxID=117018 RepID=A0A9P7GC02_9AGAR|nr:hypothetical protein DXG03_008532 [Asterophora parasitica]